MTDTFRGPGAGATALDDDNGAERRRRGIALAFVAALVSGIAVFVNSYGVGRAPDGTTYTTAKNLVAVLLLVLVAGVVSATRHASAPRLPVRASQRVALVAIGVLGGGVAFACFFEGLARLASASGDPARATQAQFLHKTLVIWVAVLAFVFLRERVGPAVVGAIGLLVAGQYVLVGDLGSLGAGPGEILIGLATLLWAVETVAARWILADVPAVTVALARMGVGVLVLLGWLALRGQLGSLAWDPSWWGWALGTGAVLAVYVAVWFAALARARAVDVTAVLTAAVLVTYLLNRIAARPVTVDTSGLVLIAAGVAVVVTVAMWPRRQIVEAPA